MTGSEIIASKPVHVFSGNVRAWVPDLTGKSRDHLIEEILPRDRYEYTYLQIVDIVLSQKYVSVFAKVLNVFSAGI